MRNATAFLIGALATTALLRSETASAEQWRVHHAISCMARTGPGYPVLTYYGPSVAGQIANESGDFLIANCPVENDSLLNITAASSVTLTVRGYSNVALPAFNTFKACRTYADGSGGICTSPEAKTSSVGVYVLNVSPAVWLGGYDRDPLYVSIGLVGGQNGSFNTFWQYRVSTY
jgi:hypothetical protein